MEIIKANTQIDFLGKRKLAAVCSVVLIVISIAALFTRGLNFGIDFTGGTLVEVGYEQSVEIETVRTALEGSGFSDAVVQHFGTSKDVLVRLPAEHTQEGKKAAELSGEVMEALREPYNETLSPEPSLEGLQQCTGESGAGNCAVQMRRVEFVGPQVDQQGWTGHAICTGRYSPLRNVSLSLAVCNRLNYRPGARCIDYRWCICSISV